ncbi:GDSL-type esterase/lipase family protein [Sphingomonas hankookensis]|uniref:GDSL-type esterase/lipase family protein n=1 Tax=Sphingomonas hankookensis TaxID=563996 RepID=UPI003F78B4EA
MRLSSRRLVGMAVAAGALSVAFLAGYLVLYYRVKPYSQINNLIFRIDPYNPRTNASWLALSDLYKGRGRTDGIAFFGDSNVEYGDWNRLLRRTDIVNHGIAGDTSRGLLLRLREGEPGGRINMVLIGVNDVRSGISTAETLDNVTKIVTILGPKRTTVVSTLLTGFAERNEAVKAIADGERAMCAQLGCRFVDANATLVADNALKPMFTMDKVHLKWVGYQQLATIIASALPAS